MWRPGPGFMIAINDTTDSFVTPFKESKMRANSRNKYSFENWLVVSKIIPSSGKRRNSVKLFGFQGGLLAALVTISRNVNNHVTEYCTVIGPHCAVRRYKPLYGKSPDPLSLVA